MAARRKAPFPGLTYRQEMVRCGKANCKKCENGKYGHGPYWYAYNHAAVFTQKIYVGKKLPEIVAQVLGVNIGKETK